MLLAINIGNTSTVFGIYQKAALLGQTRIASVRQEREDELGLRVKSFLAGIRVKVEEVKGVGISSVVPSLTDVYAGIARSYFGVGPMIVSASLDLGIQIHYKNPSTIGADRLCSGVAGYAKYGGPLIIIDFGTATTYNVIASNGDFLGGVIAPGIQTSALSLHNRTAQLPEIELRLPENAIGSDTMSSMQSGVLLGSIDAVVGMVKRIRDELRRRESKKAIIIATGGFSEFMGKNTDVIEHVEPALVLEGIRILYEKMGRKEKHRR